MSLLKKILTQPGDKKNPRIQEALQVGHQTYKAGRIADSEQLYLEALDLSRKLRSHSDTVESFFCLAAVHAQHDPPKAVHDLIQCEQTARSHLRDEDLSGVLNDIAEALTNLGHAEEAKAKYSEAISLDQRTGDVNGWINKLVKLCVLNREEGLYSICHELCVEGMRISESHKNPPATISMSLTYVDLLRDVLEAPEVAKQYMRKLEILVPRYAEGDQRAEYEYQQACSLLKAGQLDEAEERMGRVALSARYTRQTRLLQSAQLALAALCVARQNFAGLHDVLDHLSHIEDLHQESKVDLLRTRLALHHGRLREAIEIVEEIPQQRGWREMERFLLLAVLEARMGVTVQADDYLRHADQVFLTIRSQTPLEFHDNLQRKPEVVELRQVKELLV